MKISHSLKLFFCAATFLVPLAFAVSASAQQASPAKSAAVEEVGNSAALTLNDVIGIALKEHGDVGAAEENYFGATEGITSARSALYPQITAGLNYNYQNGSRTITNNSSGSFNSSGVTSSLSVTQDIFDGGKVHATVQQAKSLALNAVGAVGTARNTLAYTVATNYYNQLLDEKLVTQQQEEVSLAQQQVDMIQAQVTAGTAAASDVQGVQVTLSQAQFNLVTSQNNLSTAQIALRQSMGLGRGSALQLQEPSLSQDVVPTPPPTTGKSTFTLPPLPPLPVVPPLKNLDDYLAQAQQLRPDLLQANANVDKSKAGVSLAQIAQRPQISVNAGYNIEPLQTQNRGVTFGAGISIPIFDGGGRKADERAAEDALKASQIRLAQLQKDVAADVEETYVNVSGEEQRIKNAQALVISARTNFQTASEKYQLGLGIVLDVVNAQTQLFSAQTSLTQALYDYQLALANLERATGRFAWANPGMAPPAQAPTTLPEAIKVEQK
ncbi:MAG: TolC family protein [Abditibacteriaceae bacterium]